MRDDSTPMQDDPSFDLPITAEEADRVARELGFRLSQIGPGAFGFEDRAMAVFVPLDDRSEAVVTDGRTPDRALRRGIALCRARNAKSRPRSSNVSKRPYAAPSSIQDPLRLFSKLDQLNGAGSHVDNLIIQQIKDAAPLAVLISAENVSRFFADHHANLDFERDIPNIVPPFTTTWVEYTDYRSIPHDPRRVGVLVLAMDVRDESVDDARDEARQMLQGQAASAADQIRLAYKRAGMEAHPEMIARLRDFASGIHGPIVSSCRWMIRAMYFIEGRSTTGAIGPMRVWEAALDDTGNVARFQDGSLASLTYSPVHDQADQGAPPVGMVPAFLAFAFSHCKNVSIAEQTLPRAARRRLERAGKADVTFRVLSIDPMRTVLQSEGNINHNGLKKALHICRGNFAHYSEDKPLFGKYAGTFWRPAHVRGTAEAGMIGKDYAVKAPR